MPDPKKDTNKDKDGKSTTDISPDEYKMAFELRPQQYHSPPTYHYDAPSGSK